MSYGIGPGSRNLNQVATYWGPGTLRTDGDRDYEAPVRIMTFWTEDSQLIRTASGEEITTRAVIHCSQRVAEQGWLAQGDQTAQPDPLLTNAEEIKAYQESPDLRNMDQNRRAYI